MPNIETIFTHNDGRLGIGKDNRLYWNGEEIVTKADLKLVWWVNVAIVIGAISTALYAVVTVLDYLGIYVL
jgi:hypothetical protein